MKKKLIPCSNLRERERERATSSSCAKGEGEREREEKIGKLIKESFYYFSGGVPWALAAR